MAELTGKLSAIPSLSGELSSEAGLVGNIEHSTRVVYYGGSYLVIPSAEEQVLPTSGKELIEDVVVAPIPNNYGLITWNGSYLTVS